MYTTGQTMRIIKMKKPKRVAVLLVCLVLAAAGVFPAAADTPEQSSGEPDPAPLLPGKITLQKEKISANETVMQTNPSEENYVAEEDPLSVFTINHGNRNSKKIAITMDDMFDTEWTWKTLALCKEYGITMTFFPIGRSLKEEDRENWRAVIEAGCEIGSHSSYHAEFKGIGEWIAIGRLGRFQEMLDKTLGFHYEVRWFRPPFGNISDSSGRASTVMVRAIRTYGYEHILRWDVSNTDADKAFAATQNGSILLYHSRHKDYVCLTELIPRLLEAGFQPVTVSELFGYPPPETSEKLYTFDIHNYVGK